MPFAVDDFWGSSCRKLKKRLNLVKYSAEHQAVADG